MDNFDKYVYPRTIRNFHAQERTVPTIVKLFKKTQRGL
jgi:hypothetical protein